MPSSVKIKVPELGKAPNQITYNIHAQNKEDESTYLVQHFRCLMLLFTMRTFELISVRFSSKPTPPIAGPLPCTLKESLRNRQRIRDGPVKDKQMNEQITELTTWAVNCMVRIMKQVVLLRMLSVVDEPGVQNISVDICN